MLRFVPNAKMYLTMYVRKEALLSAQIEGTQCTFDDVLNPECPELAEKDVADVDAYVRATEYAIKRLGEIPLCGGCCVKFMRSFFGIRADRTRTPES
jgi:hypothetical protein